MDKLTIKDCADSIIEIMRRKQYSESTINQYSKIFTDFCVYSNQKDIDYFDEVNAVEYANLKTGLELKDLAQEDKDKKKYIVLLRAMRVLSEYARTRTFTSRFSKFHEPVEENDYWNTIYNSFLSYLKIECDYKESTIKRKELMVRKAMNTFIELNVQSLDSINESAIETMVSIFIHETPKSVTHNLGDLKQFFQYCHESSMVDRNIVKLFPEIKTPHETKIPAALSLDESKRLLESIDRNDPKGKRDFAILMTASHLGLRAVDIINLKLSDFDWKNKRLTITQEKTNRTVTLPLLNDVGWSIIDYIKNGRPNIENEYLFLRHNSPFDRFSNSAALSNMFSKRLHDAGIRIKRTERCGIHSLRHTLGTALLEKETPLPVISQILGHQSIRSTDVYLRINMKGLKECPINPERVFNNEV